MASKTIFIEHKVGCDLANASSVLLQSEDDDFGIKELNAGTVIVPSGTSVENPSTGRYEYTFDTEPTVVYLVSWRIVSNASSDPIFRTETFGPFGASSSHHAVTDFRGSFRQGTVGNLQVRIHDFNGNAIDPTSITLVIRDEEGTEAVASVVPEKIVTGFYVYDWEIDSDESPGRYFVTWSYTILGQTFKEVQDVVIAEDATNSAFYSGSVFVLRNSLEQYLSCAMHIPVYHEQARPSIDNNMFQFTKGQWNQTPGMRIYRNQRIVNNEVEVNYNSGSVKFHCELLPQDVVAADYNFRWFSDAELDQFILNGINMLNAFPPFSPAFNIPTLVTQGTQFIPHVLYGAAIDAMRNLMMCLQFQQPAQFFGGLDRASEVFSNLETLKQNYEKQWELLLENKKYGPYPVSRLVVVPEFTLPGGRSLLLTSKGLMRIDGQETGEEFTLKDAKKYYDNGHKIDILSQDDVSGRVVFAPVSHIWDSGIKEVFRLKCKNGYMVDSSDEHLFFANGDYKPLQYIKEGDTLVCHDGNVTEYSEVKSISSSGRKKHMLDLEVNSTANLFVNGIKSHNSRWFRYLFASGSGG